MQKDCFYYGVYTPDGICSLMPKAAFSDTETYILEGDSRFLKQEIFRFVRNELEKHNMDFTDFMLADEMSAGVYSADGGFRIIDGEYAEAGIKNSRVINFDDYAYEDFFEKKTKEREELISLREGNLERCFRFLKACRCIGEDMERLEEDNIDSAKLNRFTVRLWQKYGSSMTGRVGTEKKRFVSSISADGAELNMKVFDECCDKVIVLCDNTGAAARRITDRIRRYALGAGYDVISCMCPLGVKKGAEHIIIPQLRLGLFTVKYYHRAEFRNSRRIYAKRFLRPSSELVKHRMEFSMKAYKKLMNEAFDSLEEAKKCEKKLDRYYIAATDTEKLYTDIREALFK